MKEYWIIEDVWREIKTYLFHNIKIHGKHLKKGKNITQFNKVVKSLPRKHISSSGPRLVYQSSLKPYRCVKLIYNVKAPCAFSKKKYSLRYKLIIEYLQINGKSKDEIRKEYYNNIPFLLFTV
tara:strand:+ start:37 stop:405 length:369 start_codon:yes stop_codon:yes gene_type:complete